VPELVLRHRVTGIARIARIAWAILKASSSLALVSLAALPSAALPSASSLPISLPTHVAFLLLFYQRGVDKPRQGSYPEAPESRLR
jgi:hypothetical protein